MVPEPMSCIWRFYRPSITHVLLPQRVSVLGLGQYVIWSAQPIPCLQITKSECLLDATVEIDMESPASTTSIPALVFRTSLRTRPATLVLHNWPRACTATTLVTRLMLKRCLDRDFVSFWSIVARTFKATNADGRSDMGYNSERCCPILAGASRGYRLASSVIHPSLSVFANSSYGSWHLLRILTYS
ncbi:hypothetical protein OBBRIDRAFT_246191 [Obba rivulosa]|uniref:Uncharacterized protein n=1 Tax=Obba rivulosa TaxID=1052685 RepID=A0A8E2DKY7_9APHY|nr:hypothetical protein OBBRIDRAFT_246191 [Obba rivulosa]